MAAGSWQLPPTPPLTWNSVRVVLGLLIVVQGFETVRFLKGEYPVELRCRAMLDAQGISTAIYLLFFALALVAIGGHSVDGDVAAVTNMLAGAAVLLPLMLVLGAAFAQASAAIADAIGAAGLLADIGGHYMPRSRGYVVVAAVGIVLVWSTDVFGVIALASRAFAFFYFIQSLVAVEVVRCALNLSRRGLKAAWFLALAGLAATAVVFGLPAEGG